MTSSRRHAFFRAWAFVLARQSRAVLWLAALLTALAMVAATRIEIRAGRVDLLGERDPVARAWLDFGADFGSPNGIVVLLEGGEPADRRVAVDVMVEILRTREHDLYRNILYKVDGEFQATYGAYYLDAGTLERLHATLQGLRGNNLVTWGEGFDDMELRLRKAARSQMTDPHNRAALETVVSLAETWAQVMETGEDPGPDFELPVISPLAAELVNTPVDDFGYLVSNDGVRHLLFVDPRSDREDAADFLLPFMSTLNEALAAGAAARPDVHVRMTGMSAYAYQDLEVIRSEIPWLTALSLVALVIIFRAAFSTLRPALYAGGALLLSLTWTLGLTALVIGHLTLVSSVFGLILIGLGIDYGIYLVVLYTQARRALEPADALAEAFERGVNGVLTGGVTTAAAFALCTVADFAGFAELGAISAIGICCNLVAMLAVLPALLVAGEQRAAARNRTLVNSTTADSRLERLLGSLGRVLERRLWLGIAAGLVAVVWAAPKVAHVPFDYTFLNLQPANSPFPEAERILFNTTSFAPHFNLVLADNDAEARALADRLRTLPTVRDAIHIALLMPKADAVRDGLVIQVREDALAVKLPGTTTAEDAERIDAALNRMRVRFTAFERGSFSLEDKAMVRQLQRLIRAIERIRGTKQDLGPEEWTRRAGAFLDAVVRAWAPLRARMDAIATEPPGLADLPVELHRRFIGQSGRQAVYVIPTHTLWDIDFLLKFNADVASVSEDVTGIGTLLAELFVQSSAAPRQVGTWVGGVILLVLLLDYRDPRPVIAACAALVLGVVCVVGGMHARGMNFNPVNILAFPLLLGIGIDNSVHVLHRLRSPDRPSFELVFSTTGKGVFLASLTSFTSFGLLSLSTHRGLAGFGQVMAMGVVGCYLSAILVLPCFWRLAERIWGGGGRDTDTIES